MIFSKKLIERCEEYYKYKTGIELSDEQTQEFLTSLADLYRIAGEMSLNSEKTTSLLG